MAKGLSPEFRIMGIIILLFAILSLFLVITLHPLHPKIMAVMMKYLWVFIGGAIVIAVIFSRMLDNAFLKDEGNLK